MDLNLFNLRKQFIDPSSINDGLAEFQSLLQLYFTEVGNLGSLSTPVLGTLKPHGYGKVQQQRIPDIGLSKETVIGKVLEFINGSIEWAHPLNIVAPAPPPTILSMFANLVCNHLGPNLLWDRFSQEFARAELELASMIADLVGYDPSCSFGFSTFGGAGTILYGIKIGMENARVSLKKDIANNKMRLFLSEDAHFSNFVAANWLGLEQDSIIKVKRKSHHLDYEDLSRKIREAVEQGCAIASINAEAGATFDFGIDDIGIIAEIRDGLVKDFSLPYRPHIHVDAVIGWIYSVFADYNLDENPLKLSNLLLDDITSITHKIRTLRNADSIGIDFHKLGYSPLTSSLFLVKNSQDLNLISRTDIPLPKIPPTDFGTYLPGAFTLECTRPATGIMSAYVNCLNFGKQGFQLLLAHNLDIARYFKEKLNQLPFCEIINSDCPGPAVLIRFYPSSDISGKKRFMDELLFTSSKQIVETNNFNKDMLNQVLDPHLSPASGYLSLADPYKVVYGKESGDGTPIVAIKSYMLSPFTEKTHIDNTIERINLAYNVLIS
ncbi:MAG: pyridoxal phosphate-dependent decarboxylase family protein [Chloroflexota bacterium]